MTERTIIGSRGDTPRTDIVIGFGGNLTDRESNLLDHARELERELATASLALSDVTQRAERAEKLLREAFNAMDEVRVTLVDRADHSGISSVLAMTLADSQRDIKAFQEGKQ